MRAALLYLALVGIPVLGVLGILEAGKGLTPPTSVHGAWNITLDPAYAADPACNDPLHGPGPAVLTISQSGPRLLLTFNDQAATALAGTIQGQTVTASGTAAIAVRATADRPAVSEQLQGEFAFPGCQNRAAVRFTATRQPHEQEKAGGH